MIAMFFAMAFPVCMAFAAANDLFTMKIPNKISIVLIAAFFAAALLSGMPVTTIGINVLIAACVLVATFLLFSYNMLGGGDAKLMAAGALWMGSDHIIEFLAFVTIFGGVLALVILAYRRAPAQLLTLPGWAQRLHVDGTGIPYGIAIAASGLMIFPHTEIFRVFAG